MTRKEDGTYHNEIVLTPYKQMNAKNLARESELHRILLHLEKEAGGETEKNKSGYTVIINASDFYHFVHRQLLLPV